MAVIVELDTYGEKVTYTFSEAGGWEVIKGVLSVSDKKGHNKITFAKGEWQSVRFDDFPTTVS